MADTKGTGLTELTDPAPADLVYAVDDPAGTPASRKLTIQNLLEVVNGLTDLAETPADADRLLVIDDPTGTPVAKYVARSDLVGVSGAVVGTTDSQTLTNKTIDGDNNTVSNLAIGAEVSKTASPTFTISDSASAAPLNITERSAAPSSPASNDVYLDDGTNTASGNPGWRRYTGAAWEDVSAGGGGGDEWGDAVDANIVPDADGTRDLGADATRFGNTYTDTAHVTTALRTNDGAQFISEEADAADAVGFDYKTENALSTAGALHSQWTKSDDSALMSLSKDGRLKLSAAGNNARIEANKLYLSGDVSASSWLLLDDISGDIRAEFAAEFGANDAEILGAAGAAGRSVTFGSKSVYATVFRGGDALSDAAVFDTTLRGANAKSDASTNQDGGDLNIDAGAKASGGGTDGAINIAGTGLLGFFSATAVAQQATTGTTTGFTAGAGSAVLDDSTFTGNSGTAAYTIGDIVLALKNYGLLAAS